MDFAFLKQWSDFLPTEGGHVVALSGSLDKGPLLKVLADHYAHLGLPFQLAPGGAPGKPAPADRLHEQFPEDIILCEVDPPTGYPVSLQGPGRLSWPATTSLALITVGCDAVGALAASVLGMGDDGGGTPGPLAALGPEAVFQWEHLECLLLDKDGCLDQVPGPVPVAVVLTGVEETADSIGLFGCVGRIMQHDRIPLVVFCSRKDNVLQLRTAYRIDLEDRDHG